MLIRYCFLSTSERSCSTENMGRGSVLGRQPRVLLGYRPSSNQKKAEGVTLCQLRQSGSLHKYTLGSLNCHAGNSAIQTAWRSHMGKQKETKAP